MRQRCFSWYGDESVTSRSERTDDGQRNGRGRQFARIAVLHVLSCCASVIFFSCLFFFFLRTCCGIIGDVPPPPLVVGGTYSSCTSMQAFLTLHVLSHTHRTACLTPLCFGNELKCTRGKGRGGGAKVMGWYARKPATAASVGRGASRPQQGPGQKKPGGV